MVEPIKLLYDEYGCEITEGKCYICGHMWKLSDYKIRNNRNNNKIINRYMDGMPKNFSINDIRDVCYCKHCNNVSTVEFPFSDVYGVRDRNNTEEYKAILNSNENEKIKRIKLAEYKFGDTKGEPLLLTLLSVYWYYDSINDVEKRDEYAKKAIDVTKRYRCSGIKIGPDEIGNITRKGFYLSQDYILVDLFRRQGDFESAYKQIEQIYNSFVYTNGIDTEEQWLNFERELCDKKDIRRY